MSKPNISVASKTDSSSSTPIPPPCNVWYRWILHVGRCVSVYFDPHQPAAVWDEHQHTEVQFLYFGPGSDCTLHWMQDNAWSSRHVHAPFLWVIGAGVPHKLEWRQPALRLVFYVQPSFVAEFNGLEITGESLFSVEVVERCNPTIIEFIRGFEQLEQPRTTSESIHVESLGSLASMHLCQAWSCLTSPSNAWPTLMSRETLARVDAFIETHIDQKILLLDIARDVGMSKTNFMRLFKKRTGMTPGRHLISVRIQKSKTLLIEKDWNIGSIALAVGFANQGHFDFYFKRLTGRTPKEFRLSHRIGDIPCPGIRSGDPADFIKPFAREDVARSERSAGLGLTIVDRVVRLHGGRLHLENANRGGLSVTIELPFRAIGPMKPLCGADV